MSVYFITCRELGVVKIGSTTNPAKRAAYLQTGCPMELRLEAVMDGGEAEEHALHARFGAYRKRGEWFFIVAEIAEMIAANPAPQKPPRLSMERGTVDALICRFGDSQSEFARMLDVPVSTVNDWRMKRRIPHWRHHQITKLAATRGVHLRPSDFPPQRSVAAGEGKAAAGAGEGGVGRLLNFRTTHTRPVSHPEQRCG